MFLIIQIITKCIDYYVQIEIIINLLNFLLHHIERYLRIFMVRQFIRFWVSLKSHCNY